MNVSAARAALRLSLQDLIDRRGLAAIMALSIAIASAMVTFLEAYRAGLAAEFSEQTANLLVVHDNQNVGDITGSRIPGAVGGMLSDLGISSMIPEIRTITGTSVTNAILLRGIDPERYTRLEGFRMLSGRRLAPGDPPRLAMVGRLLAERQGLQTGGTISLRGRDFTVIGVFENGTYMDNQAWISLSDAQTLLGWEQDVSVYVIPDEGILHAGESLPGGLAVTAKGADLELIAAQYRPLLEVWQLVSLALGAAASLTLASLLWRLAWLHRRELAILRTIGFSNRSLAAYLLVQAGGIALPGILLGGSFTLLVAAGVRLTVSSFTIVPRLDAVTLLGSLAWVGLLVLAGSLLPAWWLSRLNLAGLLHSE